MLKGIDYSIGNGVTAAAVKGAGYSFVCRYLSDHLRLSGTDKDISAAEVKNYHAAGVAIIFNWETSGTDMTSVASGVADARAAQAELGALAAAAGQPSVAQAPVFFSADEASEPDVAGYFQGVNSVIGKARSGIYGGYASVKQAFDAGVVAYGWQTTAWSNGQWDTRALIRQTGSVQVGPASCDADEAAFWTSATVLGPGDDFGQWPRPASAPGSFPAPTLVTFAAENTYAAKGYQTGAVTWEPVPGAGSYQGEIRRVPDTTVVLPFQVSGTTVTDISLAWDAEYNVRVRCHPTGDTPDAAWSQTAYCTTPAP